MRHRNHEMATHKILGHSSQRRNVNRGSLYSMDDFGDYNQYTAPMTSGKPSYTIQKSSNGTYIRQWFRGFSQLCLNGAPLLWTMYIWSKTYYRADERLFGRWVSRSWPNRTSKKKLEYLTIKTHPTFLVRILYLDRSFRQLVLLSYISTQQEAVTK